MELLAVLLALLVLSAPVFAISAFVRQRKLRLGLEELANHTSRQNDALHRELLELRRQFLAISQPPSQTVTVHEQVPEAPAPVVTAKPPQAAVPERSTETPAEPPKPRPVTATPTPPPPKTEPILCPWCGTVHAGGVSWVWPGLASKSYGRWVRFARTLCLILPRSHF